MKKCPYCAEEIQDEAIYCRWCEHDLTVLIHQVHKGNNGEYFQNKTTNINSNNTSRYTDSPPKTRSPRKYWWIFIAGVILVIIYLFFNKNVNSYTSKVTDTIKSEDYYFLQQQYSRFNNLYTRLNNSQALGTDVKAAYDECMNVISTLNTRSMFGNSVKLKIQLVEGISSMCKGFGCYSNSSLCQSDAEATQLLSSGNRTIEKFLNNMNFLQSSDLIIP